MLSCVDDGVYSIARFEPVQHKFELLLSQFHTYPAGRQSSRRGCCRLDSGPGVAWCLRDTGTRIAISREDGTAPTAPVVWTLELRRQSEHF